MYRYFKSLLAAPPRSPELLQAQISAFSRQLPLMYALVTVNSLTVAATHLNSTPLLLAVGFPALLCAIALYRMAVWIRTQSRTIDFVAAQKVLRQTVIFAVILGVGFTGWALSLLPYGDAYAKAHVAFYMGLTAIGCVFCLTHVRTAALLLTGLIVGPMTVAFALSGNPVFIAMAVNLVLVAVTMIIILLTYYRDFSDLVESRRSLEIRQDETQRLSDENLRLANLDNLTGLPNRRQFFALLDEMTTRPAGGRFVVGVIDLDGFKPVNDAYGHAVGDRVLVEAGERLSRDHGEPLFVARLGGDEYGLILDGDLSDDALSRLGARLCDTLRAPYVMPGVTAQVTGSVGFAAYPEAALTPELLYERADYALYHAKQHVRGSAVVFSEAHETEIRKSGLIEQALRHADIEAEFSLAYQPIVDIDSGRAIACEALARWTSPTLGVVSPGDFVPVAERSGLIASMSPVFLGWALKAAAGWPDHVRLSFNLSVRDITDPDQIERMVQIIRAGDLAPSRIDLEITETAMMRDFEQAERSLAILKTLGVRISLDDFGAGYSSLGYVHRLPIDKLKIDSSFVQGLEEGGKRRAIVKTIIDLCRNLSLDCVVEGVETPQQVLLLRALGCRIAQGYLFARPMSGAALDQWLAHADQAAEEVDILPDGAANDIAILGRWLRETSHG